MAANECSGEEAPRYPGQRPGPHNTCSSITAPSQGPSQGSFLENGSKFGKEFRKTQPRFRVSRPNGVFYFVFVFVLGVNLRGKYSRFQEQ